MDISTLLCNDENNDVEMKDVSNSSTNLPLIPELEQPKTIYESTDPIFYSTMSNSNSLNAMTNEEIPNMNTLTINSPTSTPSTPSTKPSNILTKLDSLSGIAAATAALRQRKHVRNSPRARKSVLTIGNGSSSPSTNHYPYTTTVGSSRHRLLTPVTPQPPPSHPISSAILRRNRIQNGIRNVVRGVSDTLFTHNNQRQSESEQDTNAENSNLNTTTDTNTNINSNANSNSNYSPYNIFGHINHNNSSSSSSQQAPLVSENNLNQDDINHDQEINLLRNIANESFHMYCNNIQNYRNGNNNDNNDHDNTNNNDNDNINNNENSNNNNSNSNSNSNNSENVSNNSNDNNSLLPPFQFGSIEIIIKGASKYLPGESRLIIRRFILSLPSRLSKLTQKVKTPECITSTTATTTATTSTITTTTTTTNINGKMMDTNSSVISSPASSYMTDEPDTKKQSNDDNTLNAINATKEESLKIMTLATEGNDMLKKMMDVFEKSFQENNKNNLDNINLVNSNEYSTFNYNTNKILYNPLQNNNKYNKLGNNNFNTEITTNTTSVTTTTTSNSNYIMSYDESLNNFTNNH
ncbi:hypothetical protein LY90DRAFT_704776 [Neocallimastix californiae]|uniref:Uncharacterized protein n=1 Tax=Neocallimastix californiae TaxID=1754190 RepID=A0A1Y2BPW2_9FUNG|nr:hypothetical protein LY90DRAFT_704776 [Neocallimastix californiae]|eukprot:ORY36789.1 hypothetical protein LY90DRAFT_704776 [Neocallimastix californiae]